MHVARTLPGEIVRVRADAARPAARVALEQVLQPSPDRVSPPCPHFLQLCGGCALQHWRDAAYAEWKRDLVVAALTRAGFASPSVAALVRTPPGCRRRMDFALRRRDRGIDLGLHRAHATEIVGLTSCAVLDPRLVALLAPLKPVLASLSALRRTGSLVANLLASGVDLLIRTDGPLTPADRIKLADFARAAQVARISWAQGEATPEPAVTFGTPHILFGGRRVEPPPGAFLQASPQGEQAILSAMLQGLPAAASGRPLAVELYAGCGTLSFALAERMRVEAYEGDAAAAACVRRAQSGTRVTMTHRDLARQPLSAKEMAGAAVVVLDPPHAGAVAQMGAIAASGVKRVIYISCNPAALSRDAAMLAHSGYRLIGATPIDQFLWSAQVESVAVFEK